MTYKKKLLVETTGDKKFEHFVLLVVVSDWIVSLSILGNRSQIETFLENQCSVSIIIVFISS